MRRRQHTPEPRLQASRLIETDPPGQPAEPPLATALSEAQWGQVEEYARENMESMIDAESLMRFLHTLYLLQPDRLVALQLDDHEREISDLLRMDATPLAKWLAHAARFGHLFPNLANVIYDGHVGAGIDGDIRTLDASRFKQSQLFVSGMKNLLLINPAWRDKMKLDAETQRWLQEDFVAALAAVTTADAGKWNTVAPLAEGIVLLYPELRTWVQRQLEPHPDFFAAPLAMPGSTTFNPSRFAAFAPMVAIVQADAVVLEPGSVRLIHSSKPGEQSPLPDRTVA